MDISGFVPLQDLGSVAASPVSPSSAYALSETPAKGGVGLVETCFSSLGRMVAFPGKRPWLGCCLQESLIESVRSASNSGKLTYNRLERSRWRGGHCLGVSHQQR